MKERYCPKCKKEQKGTWQRCEQCGFIGFNNVSEILKIVSVIIIILGIIVNFMMSYDDSSYTVSFNLFLFIDGVISYIIGGLILFGLGELILLFQKFYSLLRK